MNSSHSVWKDSLPFYKSAYSMQNAQKFPEMLRANCGLEYIIYFSEPLGEKMRGRLFSKLYICAYGKQNSK